MSTEEKMRVVNFNGNGENWWIWRGKFLAIATKKGWNDILTGTSQVPKNDEVLDENNTNEKEKILIRAKNKALYAELMLSQDNQVAFDIVDEATTDALPDGDLALAWKNLKEKYEGTSLTELIALKKEYYLSKLMKLNNDPDVWISTLEKL